MLVRGCYGTRLYRMRVERWIVSELEKDGSGMMCDLCLRFGRVVSVWSGERSH